MKGNICMPAPSLFKRRQLLGFGGVGVAGLLAGAAVTKAVDVSAHPSVISGIQPLQQPDMQAYIDPGGFEQQFLTKSADIKQIWDFVTVEQVQPQGLTAVRNALNAFQFIYNKTLYAVLCLRGGAVIYALDDAIWAKYDLLALSGQKIGAAVTGNPCYRRRTADNGALSPDDPQSLYQDASLQALVQRGSHLAVCHDALSGLAVQLAQQHGIPFADVLAELAAHLVAGAQQTPSGSSLIAVAQYFGFTYAKQ